VFAYVDRPENRAEITPSLVRSETVRELETGGREAEYEYAMAGVSLQGRVRATDYRPDERIVFETTGDLTGEIEWRFEAENGGTRVTYTADYGIPVPVLDRVVAPFVRRYDERELRTTLGTLRTRPEADADASGE
jgi:carbon monoxide dehydrogenase subunit G